MNVELLDYMGGDLAVVNAARVSFGKQKEELDEKDIKLIRYLAKHKHWTPFAHSFLTFRIHAPIFVARQLAKHQVGLVWNEESRRYVDYIPEVWIPDRWRKRAPNIKQGSLDEPAELPPELLQQVEEGLHQSVKNYQMLLEHGVAPEQARAVLPQAMYTTWWWSGSLMAFARVCALRLDSHAQEETREIAEQIDFLIAMLPDFRYSWEALRDHS